MSVDRAREAYSARAEEYIDKIGSMDVVAIPDRELVLGWARGLRGTVLDVGCGPGQWTNFLREAGIEAEGIDPVENFIDHAQRRYPSVPFRLGCTDDLGVAEATLGGVFAWYSLIHTEPDRLDPLLGEFARVIAPGGGLLIGFFEGPIAEPFEHAVTTAYRWPVDELAQRVTEAGFTVTGRHTRTDEGRRPHGALVATLDRD